MGRIVKEWWYYQFTLQSFVIDFIISPDSNNNMIIIMLLLLIAISPRPELGNGVPPHKPK